MSKERYIWLTLIALLLVSFLWAMKADAYSYSSGSRSFSVPSRSYSAPSVHYSAPSVRSYTPSVSTFSVPARSLTTVAPQVTQTVVHEYGYNPFSSNFFIWYWLFSGHNQTRNITNVINQATTTATSTHAN